MNISSRQMEFFEFLCSLDREQLEKYFLMLGPIESEYVRQMVLIIGKQVTTELNLQLAEVLDDVEDLAAAKSVLSKYALKG